MYQNILSIDLGYLSYKSFEKVAKYSLKHPKIRKLINFTLFVRRNVFTKSIT